MIAFPIRAEHIVVTGQSILTLSTLLNGLERLPIENADGPVSRILCSVTT